MLQVHFGIYLESIKIIIEILCYVVFFKKKRIRALSLKNVEETEIEKNEEIFFH